MTTAILKWFTRLLIALICLAAAALASVIAILNTEDGTRWLIDEASRRINGDLRVPAFRGTLWSGLQVPSFTFENENLVLTADELTLDIDWPRLAPSRLILAEASARTFEYRSLAPVKEAPEPFRIGMRPVPIRLGINRGAAGELRIASQGKVRILRNVEIDGLRLRDDRISATSIALSNEVGWLKTSRFAATLGGDVPIAGHFEWRDSDNRWSGDGQAQGSLAELEFEHQLRSPYPASMRGTARFLHRVEPLLDLAVRWNDWEFGDYKASAGVAQVSGYVFGYEGRFDFQLSDRDGRWVRLAGSARGDLQGLSELDATADTAAGRLAAKGPLTWSPAMSTSLRIKGQSLDFSQVAPVPSTDIGLDLTFTMQNRLQLQVIFHSIDGSYVAERFTGKGTLTRNDRLWRCANCELRVGDNRARFEGTLDDRALAVQVDLDAPNVDQLWPGAQGTLKAKGTVGGTLTGPAFTGTASGSSMTFADWRIARFAVESRASTIEQLNLNAVVEDLRRLERPLGMFDVVTSGPRERLNTRIRWALGDASGEAVGRIDLASPYPVGLVQTAQFDHPKAGEWTLSDAFRFAAGPQSFAISANAWASGSAGFSVNSLRFSEGQTEIDARLTELPLEGLQFLMPQNSELTGYLDSDIRLTHRDGQWLGSVSWNQRDTRLRVGQRNQQPVDIVIPLARFDARLLGDSADAAASIEIDPGVSGSLELRLASLSANPDIEARLILDGKDWYWMPAVFPEIDKFEGAVDAEIVARGNLHNPSFRGELALRDGSLLVPSLNVPLTDIDIVVAGTPDGDATIKGEARAGSGSLAVEGKLENLMRDNRSFTIRLTGTDAEVLDWPEYKLTASPDLQVTGSRAGVSMTGRIGIPRAEISARRLPEETVSPSADVTVLGREAQAAAATPVTGQADFVLGKNVHVNALGLDTKVGGQLTITVPDNRILRADGELTLSEGVFEAYGRRLTITTGTLLFSGPLDNPIVNVRAVRKIETTAGPVTAGIDLQGPAKNLVATVFSEPAMAEADALSYLVLGRPLEQATTTEGNELSGAALALGLRQATRITNQIGQAVGLDQLDIAGDGGSTTALVAGKQVGTRLYMRYAYGVFSQLGALLLRYKLSRRITLEASTGEAHSMDILYIVEKP